MERTEVIGKHVSMSMTENCPFCDDCESVACPFREMAVCEHDVRTTIEHSSAFESRGMNQIHHTEKKLVQ